MTPQQQAKKESSRPRTPDGPMCKCGHDMYSHYMCGSPTEMWCYAKERCGCAQFQETRLTRAEPLNA